MKRDRMAGEHRAVRSSKDSSFHIARHTRGSHSQLSSPLHKTEPEPSCTTAQPAVVPTVSNIRPTRSLTDIKRGQMLCRGGAARPVASPGSPGRSLVLAQRERKGKLTQRLSLAQCLSRSGTSGRSCRRASGRKTPPVSCVALSSRLPTGM